VAHYGNKAYLFTAALVPIENWRKINMKF